MTENTRRRRRLREGEAEVKAGAVTLHDKGPYTVEGCNVLDRNGVRVAICGYDHNRDASGPEIAGAIASGLNQGR